MDRKFTPRIPFTIALRVPRAERAAAIRAGARQDRFAHSLVIRSDHDLRPVARWLPGRSVSQLQRATFSESEARVAVALWLLDR